jgi:hypothetical protein
MLAQRVESTQVLRIIILTGFSELFYLLFARFSTKTMFIERAVCAVAKRFDA